MRASVSGSEIFMSLRSLRVLLAATLVALPAVAEAQFPPPPPPPGSPAPAPADPPPIQQRWPDPPQPRAAPSRTQTPPPATADKPPAPKPKPQSKPRVAPSYAVTCGGVFAKDTNHLKLAIKYDSRNIAYTDVDGPDNTKIKATVLFPRDPKRRLEVLWHNDAARSNVQVISINGQSHWTAPRGLKLGMSLAALETLNRRPFKLSGLTADGSVSVVDWAGGALSNLPGGCKVGIRLAPDRRAPENARAAAAGSGELMSNDAALKTLKPSVVEILLGY
jgi:hypothetical protein